MQEEVENRTLTLVVSGTKFTGRMFKAAISKYMAHRKEKKLEKQRSRDAPVVPHGKQTVKQLVGQNQGISNIEITDPSIKEFEKIARKYGVDYAVKKDRSSSPPKYLIFFKGRDADTSSAFSFAQNDIDHVLRLGGNTDRQRERVVAAFEKQKTTAEIAERLKTLYHGGNGLGSVSAWYAEDGIHLSHGKSVRYDRSAQVISWESAAERIGCLLYTSRCV